MAVLCERRVGLSWSGIVVGALGASVALWPLATAAAAARVPRAWIARQGRWAERSTAIDAYIRPADAWTDNPLRHVGL
ncbi:hypothetical protein [Nocardiopsis dassonvillei]|uniref:hypothetical protein n=1 Tax=Nocardiopsis dassonvillei TaxID=2014 RepID=UPI003F57C45C